MSFNSISRAAADQDLQVRIQACANQQAINNPGVSDSQFAVRIRNGTANYTSLYWSVASATDAAYEAGILAGRGSPGHDQDVVTDGAILSAVQTFWPPDEVVVPPLPVPTAVMSEPSIVMSERQTQEGES